MMITCFVSRNHNPWHCFLVGAHIWQTGKVWVQCTGVLEPLRCYIVFSFVQFLYTCQRVNRSSIPVHWTQAAPMTNYLLCVLLLSFWKVYLTENLAIITFSMHLDAAYRFGHLAGLHSRDSLRQCNSQVAGSVSPGKQTGLKSWPCPLSNLNDCTLVHVTKLQRMASSFQ